MNSDDDEEFADFVWHHFGGLWLRGSVQEQRSLAKLPARVERILNERARAYELKRGGP